MCVVTVGHTLDAKRITIEFHLVDATYFTTCAAPNRMGETLGKLSYSACGL